MFIIIHSLPFEAWPSQGDTTANQIRGLEVVFSLGPQLFPGSGMRCFCPEQFSAVQYCHVVLFSYGE